MNLLKSSLRKVWRKTLRRSVCAFIFYKVMHFQFSIINIYIYIYIIYWYSCKIVNLQEYTKSFLIKDCKKTTIITWYSYICLSQTKGFCEEATGDLSDDKVFKEHSHKLYYSTFLIPNLCNTCRRHQIFQIIHAQV